jgi:hypothetical protein
MWQTGKYGCGRVTYICCAMKVVISDVATACSGSYKHTLSFYSDFFTFCSVAALNMVYTKLYLCVVSIPVPVHCLWSSYLKAIVSYQRAVLHRTQQIFSLT